MALVLLLRGMRGWYAVLGGCPGAGQAGGLGDLEGLLLGLVLRGGAVLGPATLLLAQPGAPRLADEGPDVDGVALGAAQARLRPPVYVQRRGGVADRLDVGGECDGDGVEARRLLSGHAAGFCPQWQESQVLRGPGLAWGLHGPKHAEARVELRGR